MDFWLFDIIYFFIHSAQLAIDNSSYWLMCCMDNQFYKDKEKNQAKLQID